MNTTTNEIQQSKKRMKNYFKDKSKDENYKFVEKSLEEINQENRIANEAPNTKGLLSSETIDKVVDKIEKEFDKNMK